MRLWRSNSSASALVGSLPAMWGSAKFHPLSTYVAGGDLLTRASKNSSYQASGAGETVALHTQNALLWLTAGVAGARKLCRIAT
jgi:hypothetical protein